MLTTAAGLTVSIPSYATFTLFDGRVERIRQEMGANATQVIEIFHERAHGASPSSKTDDNVASGGEIAPAKA
jgi:biopolymer transport protein ExbB/TolQ